jgi:hypothetical protein
MLLVPSAAAAADHPVSNTHDAGAGSLRQAINEANADPGPGADTITINTTGTVTLQSALPAITHDVAITGPGPSRFTLNGANSFQVLRVQSGIVSISGLTMTHGRCANLSCGFAGGGLYNFGGDVTLSGVAITSNTARSVGGGSYNTGTLTIQNSTVSSNTASNSGGTNPSASGGGIYNSATLDVVRSTVAGNTVSVSHGTDQGNAGGGGIFNSDSGELDIDRSSVTSNHATVNANGGDFTNAFGGGIVNRHNVAITRSTVSGNTATGMNAAITSSATTAGIANVNPASPDEVTVTLDRVTLSNNTATGTSTSAGGMAIYPGDYTITSSTIAHNSASSGANLSLGYDATFKNTIVADPAGGGTNCSGDATITSYDLSSDATCGFTGTGDHLSTDPKLAATLAANGGPTKTYALQPDSPRSTRD